ncbi:restriction endonuclease subunit S [Sorangium sp. So ce134]
MRTETRKLEAVISTLIDYRGKTPSKTSSGVRLITAKVIKDGFVNDSSFEFIAEEQYDTWMRRGLPQQWDVLITTEAPLGEVAQLRTTERVALAQRVILLRANPKVMNQGFLFQALKSPFVQAELAKRATGTTVLGIKQSELRQISVPYFPLRIQCRIANILSAYDDLIENNTKRIKILEEMARSLYREWFVNFRFPGHEKVKLVDSPGGKVPAGWTALNLFEVAVVTYGFPFKSKLFSADPVGTPVIRIRDLVPGETSTFTTEDVEEKHRVRDGDVLVGMDGNFHMSKWSGGPAALNQRVVMFQPKAPVSRYFIFLALQEPIKHLESTITGTTVAHLSDKDLRRLHLLVAPPALQRRFDEAVDAMYEQELLLRRRNRILRRTRDLLLPSLISGEIDLSRFEAP